jgi:hypothetical protein
MGEGRWHEGSGRDLYIVASDAKPWDIVESILHYAEHRALDTLPDDLVTRRASFPSSILEFECSDSIECTFFF